MGGGVESNIVDGERGEVWLGFGATCVGIAGVDVASGREVAAGAPAVVHGARQVSLAM